MIGILSPDEIEAMLHRNRIGRLGCSVNDRPYVVPINYGYDGRNLYGYSVPGRKVETMREQPLVSFLVDEIEGPSAWRSVVLEAVYEELTDDTERRQAIQTITRNGSQLVSRGLNADHPLIVFRLRTIEKAGRFERRDT
jgi:nitroimidazol reductase NimA-like FMN-containing flavoprotein (pyridoxamine 5'-phosphate oxidase superfamily)